MIRRIYLQDFKAFHQLDLETRPLTIFVGENNSGKSSILSVLRLLAQTVQSEDADIPLLLSGPLGDFGAFRDVVHGNHRGRPMTLGLTVDELRAAGQPISARSVSFRSEFKYRVQRRETVLRYTDIEAASKSVIRVAANKESDSMVIDRVRGWSVPEGARSSLRQNNLWMMNFLPRVIGDLGHQGSRSQDVSVALTKIAEVQKQSMSCFQSIFRTLRRVEHVGPMRRAPERTYVNTGVERGTVGTDGRNWPEIFALDTARRNPQLGLVQEWMAGAGIAEKLTVNWLSDRHYEVVVTNPVSGETANIADVGQGTSQVLPIIVAGSRLGLGDTFIAEEPEIHLHPRAQAALGDFFLGLLENGVQSFVETHSEYLIMRIQQHVAAGNLHPDQVVFYYVFGDKSGKHVKEMKLNSNAIFERELPGGFFPQRMEEATKLARARAGKRN